LGDVEKLFTEWKTTQLDGLFEVRLKSRKCLTKSFDRNVEGGEVRNALYCQAGDPINSEALRSRNQDTSGEFVVGST